MLSGDDDPGRGFNMSISRDGTLVYVSVVVALRRAGWVGVSAVTDEPFKRRWSLFVPRLSPDCTRVASTCATKVDIWIWTFALRRCALHVRTRGPSPVWTPEAAVAVQFHARWPADNLFCKLGRTGAFERLTDPTTLSYSCRPTDAAGLQRITAPPAGRAVVLTLDERWRVLHQAPAILTKLGLPLRI